MPTGPRWRCSFPGHGGGGRDSSGDSSTDKREKKARQKRAKQRQAIDTLGGRSAYDAIAEALDDRAQKRRLWEEREMDKVLQLMSPCVCGDAGRGVRNRVVVTNTLKSAHNSPCPGYDPGSCPCKVSIPIKFLQSRFSVGNLHVLFLSLYSFMPMAISLKYQIELADTCAGD